MRVAHTLQSSLLPERLPHVQGWTSAASYQAGEQGAEVGGDFYDIVAVGAGRHLVFLGDVTGKGIAAAALTSLVRHSVRTAARFDPRPGAVLALVNEILVEQPRLSPVTLVCALIDGATLTVAAAGHPPPLLRRGGERAASSAPAACCSARCPTAPSPSRPSRCRPGDTVLLYTDGVTDTPGPPTASATRASPRCCDAAPDEPERDPRAHRARRCASSSAGTAIDDRAMLVLRFRRCRSRGLTTICGDVLRTTPVRRRRRPDAHDPLRIRPPDGARTRCG